MTQFRPDTVPPTILASLLCRISEDFKQRGMHSFNLSKNDFYKVFLTNEMFDVEGDIPQTIAIGSLHDDISELAKLINEPNRMPTAVDIERLGNVLRAVSEQV